MTTMVRPRPMNYMPQHWTCSGCVATDIKIYEGEETMGQALGDKGWDDQEGRLYCAACSEFFPEAVLQPKVRRP